MDYLLLLSDKVGLCGFLSLILLMFGCMLGWEGTMVRFVQLWVALQL
jgi:hypothetical protein